MLARLMCYNYVSLKTVVNKDDFYSEFQILIINIQNITEVKKWKAITIVY